LSRHVNRGEHFFTEVVELYDPASDPNEKHNLSADARHSPVIEHMTEQMQQFLEGSGTSTGGAEIDVDEQVAKRLRTLGYLE